ncbi:MAG: hypothetical protein DRI86_13285 [Bacteroidetes bacterium]|nr:MAG: hypothetical protein DRI86_13285 [Bacteroidota bacterium]
MRNKGFWFWGFIILLILNLSIIFSMGYFHYKMRNHGADIKSTMIHKHMSNEKMKKIRKKFWGNTNFTIEEKKFLSKNRKEHFARMKVLKSELKDNQSILFDEIRKSKPDSNSIIKYKMKIQDSQKAITDEAIRFYEKMKTKLNPEQMKIVDNHLSNMFHQNIKKN